MEAQPPAGSLGPAESRPPLPSWPPTSPCQQPAHGTCLGLLCLHHHLLGFQPSRRAMPITPDPCTTCEGCWLLGAQEQQGSILWLSLQNCRCAASPVLLSVHDQLSPFTQAKPGVSPQSFSQQEVDRGLGPMICVIKGNVSSPWVCCIKSKPAIFLAYFVFSACKKSQGSRFFKEK